MLVNKNFDWSALDRKTIARSVMSYHSLICSNALSPKQFHDLISENLKGMAPVRIKKTFSPKVENGLVYVGGSYYSALDQEDFKCIELQFYYNNPKDKLIISKFRLKRISNFIADTTLHEIMHMRQYRRRKFKALPDYNSTADKTELREEQAYLGCTDEIDAYAFNIACELYEKFSGRKKDIVSYLNCQLRNHKFNNSWRMYLKAFEYDHNHPIIKRLKKKVIYYLPAAENGKPYKSNDWINW